MITKVISTLIKDGYNIVKVLAFGKKDVRTGYNINPFGFESNIPEGYRAIYADTSEIGKKIIIGIIYDKAICETGESRLYSEKSDGTTSFEIILRTNGICEIGGNTNFAVKYNELKEELDKTNDLLTALIDIISGSPIQEPGNGANSALQTALNAAIMDKELGDYSLAKNDKIKTI